MVLRGETLSAWCRQQGIFPHTLQQWRNAFCQPLAVHHSEDKEIANSNKPRNN
ncbi:MAG: hypothetical protein IPI79_07655 [Moraxellaceae bacterium]|nr:hypothetical protein [Moraxellaceae bacterium]